MILPKRALLCHWLQTRLPSRCSDCNCLDTRHLTSSATLLRHEPMHYSKSVTTTSAYVKSPASDHSSRWLFWQRAVICDGSLTTNNFSSTADKTSQRYNPGCRADTNACPSAVTRGFAVLCGKPRSAPSGCARMPFATSTLDILPQTLRIETGAARHAPLSLLSWHA